MKSKKAKVQRFERFEELEFEECDFEWSTIVDNGIQKNKNPKIQKKIEGIRLAEMQKDAEGLNNDKGEFKKFKRERGREGRKRVDKSVKIGFYGRYFRQRGRLFTAPSVSPMLFIFIGHLRAVGVHERHGRFRDHVTNVLIFRPVYLSTCY